MAILTTAKSAIKLEQISKVYHLGVRRKKVTAIHELTLEVSSGETFAFLGLNGAGKTTTIKMMLDHARPTTGRVWLFDRDATLASSRQNVGYMPDLPHFYRFLNTQEVLSYFGKLFGLSKDETDRRIKDLVKLVGLENREKEPLKGFSRGMLQRVGLAQALINDPDLLILDEPLGGLDPVGRYQFHSIIVDLKKRGKTIFFSSHILEDAEKVADRVGIIHKGRLIASGTLSELMKYGAGWDAEVDVTEGNSLGEIASSNGWTITTDGGGTKIKIDDETGLTKLHQLVGSGVLKIKALIPRHLTLEETFLMEVEKWKA